MVCQAMIIAITVVLPAPVASFSASRESPGLAAWLALARCSRKVFPARLCGATSESQMSVSIASTWQKKGRSVLNLWWRQCWSSRAVSGVTCHVLGPGSARQMLTCERSSLMIEVGS